MRRWQSYRPSRITSKVTDNVVDIDMKAYFDTVNHDKLMYLIEKKVQDKQVLCLIRRYLMSGIMENGLVHPSEEGTPQGGNLSPLL